MAIDAQAALEELAVAAGKVEIAIAEKDTLLSSLSLRVDSLAEANFALQAQLDAERQTVAALRAEIERLKPVPEPVVKTVKDYGARGDGVTDDTVALQRALDSGECIIPAGMKLLVNGHQDSCPTITKAGTKFKQDPTSLIIIRPNNLPRYYGLRVRADDVDLDGPRILGDRDMHTYTAGSTHEHGYGLFVSGARCKVRGNWHISGCTGDGIGVTGPQHEIAEGISTKNRRQGLSGFNCDDLWVHDAEFSMTGNPGADPAGLIGPFAGIDIEPDRGSALRIKIERCKLTGNRVGFLAWVRSAVIGKLSGEVNDCEIVGNSNGAWMKDEAVRASTISFAFNRNKFTNNRNHGIRADQGSTVAGSGNTFDISTERADMLNKAGLVSPDWGRYGNAVVSAPSNHYV